MCPHVSFLVKCMGCQLNYGGDREVGDNLAQIMANNEFGAIGTDGHFYTSAHVADPCGGSYRSDFDMGLSTMEVVHLCLK